MNNPVNNTGQTLKKEKEMWKTEPVADDLLQWLFWLLCDAEFLCLLLTPQLPVIRW